MGFPEKIYTRREIEEAKSLIDGGYRHQIKVIGSPEFKLRVEESLKLVEAAGYYDFLRKYIRRIEEIDGLTQLREAEATIWTNKYAVKNPVDAASLFIQKANHMKDFLEGRLYYGGVAEKRSIQKRMEFLRELMSKSRDERVKEECERLLRLWDESILL